MMALNLLCAVLERGPKAMAEMLVLLAIADSADKDTGEAWPCLKTVARRARQSERNVRTVLRRLEVGGWLVCEARKRPNGSDTSNLYTINLDMLGEGRESVRGAERSSPSPRKNNPPPPEGRSAHGGERSSSPEPSHQFNLSAHGALKPILVSELGRVQLGELRAGRSFAVNGRLVAGGSPEAEALRFADREASSCLT